MSQNSRTVPPRSFASLATSDFVSEIGNREMTYADNPEEPLNRESPVVLADVSERQSAVHPRVRKPDATWLVCALMVITLIGLCSGFLFASRTPASPGNATAEAVVVDSANNVNLLELDIKGKPYQCRATVDSLATPQIHCEPEGPAG